MNLYYIIDSVDGGIMRYSPLFHVFIQQTFFEFLLGTKRCVADIKKKKYSALNKPIDL